MDALGSSLSKNTGINIGSVDIQETALDNFLFFQRDVIRIFTDPNLIKPI